MKLRIIAVVFAGLGGLDALSAAASHPPVSPNQEFFNPVLQIHAPGSDGWSGAAQTREKIVFGKPGPASGESFVAAVFLFRLPAFANSEAFTEYVREGAIKDTPSERFETLESDVQYSTQRDYPCVTYHAITIDRSARTSAFFKKKLRLENFTLYCQHPTKTGLGFSVSFSHRGGSVDTKIDAEAAAFIDGVQVTPPPAKVP